MRKRWNESLDEYFGAYACIDRYKFTALVDDYNVIHIIVNSAVVKTLTYTGFYIVKKFKPIPS